MPGCGLPGADTDGGNGNANVNDNENINDNDNGSTDGDDHVNVPGAPLTRFTTALFSGSGNCALCHTSLSDETGNDVSIDTHWRSTMMANAARDPFWQAAVSAEVERHPALAEIIEDACTNCHMPMAHTQATAEGTATRMLEEGFLNPANELHETAMDGVSCTLCHQISDAGLGEPESFSGEYVVDLITESPDRPLYGPFADPEQETMRSVSGYTVMEGPHVRESALCATCHTLYTPFVDAEGNVLGLFPEQVAFLEWGHSEFGDGLGEDHSCQSCHLPAADGAVVISTVPSGLEARSPFGRHHFVGGNAFMARLHRDNIEELGLTASSDDFNATIDRVLEQLQEHTATVTITEAELNGETLRVALRLENAAGHKFPTGFPSRRTWIHLTVLDGAGEVVFESGAPRADGSIAGNDADADASLVEPHYAVISAPDQVQIYESIMENSDGEVTYTLLRGAAYRKDNRLLPRGFDKATAGADFAVRGAAAEDIEFVGGADLIEYRVNTGATEGPFAVSAELLFQSVSHRFVEDLRETDTELIERFVQMYDTADKTPVVVASAHWPAP